MTDASSPSPEAWRHPGRELSAKARFEQVDGDYDPREPFGETTWP
jgi:hypothetical protein